MGESRWQRKQRHLNEDHKFRREQSKRTIGLWKSKERIDRLSDDIQAAGGKAPDERPVSKEFARLGLEWNLKKTSLLAEISSNPFLTDRTKAAWSRVLETATLTDDDDENLTSLRGKVMIESIRFDGRVGRIASLTPLVGKVEALIEIRVQSRPHL